MDILHLQRRLVLAGFLIFQSMKFILGKKLHMTQVFGEDGVVTVATVLAVSPLTVTQVKTKDSDGYEAVQVGFGSRKERNLSKPVIGHTKGLGTFEVLKEFRMTESPTLAKGDKVEVSGFAPGDVIAVTAISKGKGFQGVVKRHGFKGGPRSHGQKHSEREPGSLGGGGRDGGRVAKGKRMAGRMGGDRVTVKNLKVVAVHADKGELLVSGAVPGRRGTIVEVRGN